jgi:hypothetical protein
VEGEEWMRGKEFECSVQKIMLASPEIQPLIVPATSGMLND